MVGLALSGCTEPEGARLEGTIISIVVVKDVFQNTETTTLRVDEPGNSCDADVRVTAQTEIAFDGNPGLSATAADLRLGQTVRVTPAYTARDNCPASIDATSVSILATLITTTKQ